MSSTLKIFSLSAVVIAVTAACANDVQTLNPATQVRIQANVKPLLKVDNLEFKDLNQNNQLDIYEDWRRTPEQRAADLVSQMNLAEKAGTMMHGTLPGINSATGSSALGYDYDALKSLLIDKNITSYITRIKVSPTELAKQNNRVQTLAESQRLGIPVTISTDPRHHFQYTLGANAFGEGFSQWPEPIGFGALGSESTLHTFADIARQEYRSVGIHMALSPTADLSTEPRWTRQNQTFGSDAQAVSKLAGAYVAGFQGSEQGVTADGVSTVVKHWVGYGAAEQGLDGHNYYGRYAKVGGQKLQTHIDAFKGAFNVNTAGVMATYPIIEGPLPNGEPLEQVAAGFNRQILTELLRDELKFNGITLSDWAITEDCGQKCIDPKTLQKFTDIGMPWGVETLTRAERYIKGVKAGVDQFGGTHQSQILVEAVKQGALSEQRLDESVMRIMINKFKQGLFENPYVDPAQVDKIIGAPEFVKKAELAQRESQVLLQNKDNLIPYQKNAAKVFLHGVSVDAAQQKGLVVVDRLADADLAIVRTQTPKELLHPNHFFGSRQAEGRINFKPGDPAYDLLLSNENNIPVVISVYMGRPAILTNIIDKADVVMANFGASDAAVLDVILGRAQAKGRLPFELPASMQRVEQQDPALSNDSQVPLFAYGSGITLN